MKKLLFCALALAVLPAPGQSTERPVAPVTLYTQFAQAPPEAVFAALRSELNGIMDSAGLSFEWRSLESVTGSDVSVELVVVSFKGSCDGNLLARDRIQHGALGWTHTSDGEVLPFTDIDCDRIRGFLRNQLASTTAASRPEVFGRAVGRVLAHEIYHVVAHTLHHGERGVAKSTYTAAELTSPDFRFGERDSATLRHSKVHAALRHTDGAGGQ